MIETERLRLRPHVLDDFDQFHALTADEGMRRFLSGEPSRENSYRRLLANQGCWSWLGYGTFAIEERETGDYVGNCGVFRMARDLPGFDEHPEAGWIVAASRWGRGYAGEAMRAAQAWFDDRFGPVTTVCMIVPGNAASERLAGRLGYRPLRRDHHMGVEVQLYMREPGAPG